MMKTKLIAVNGRFLVQRTSGVQRYAREMLSALSRVSQDRYKFVLIAPRGPLLDVPDGATVVQDRFPMNSILWQQLRLPALARAAGADLLWSPTNAGPLSWPRQIVTIHDAAVFAGPEWFSWPFRSYYRALLPRLGRKALRVVTDSFFSREELARFKVAPPEKIKVISCAVAAALQGTVDLDRPREPYLLCVGSRDPRKNLTRLLEAWGKVPSERKGGARLVVAGGEARAFGSERLEEVVGDIEFAGYVSEERLAALYRGALGFVYPSLYEGFGMPPLEAMACGAPSLISAIPAHKENCGEAALYCDPLSVEDIARRMERLINDPELRKDLAARGLKQTARFSWEKSAGAFLKVLDECLGPS